MKTFSATVMTSFLFIVTCSAQNALPSTGNVGVGTLTPTNLLQVVGGTSASIGLSGAAGNVRDFTFQTGGTSRWMLRTDGTAESGSNLGSDFDFIARDDAGASLGVYLFIKRATGNVGIGTTIPSSRLHIYESNTGNNAANGITVEQAGTGNALLQFLQTSSQRWTMGIDNANAKSFKIATGTGLGTADRFTILTSGYVGIGTASPDTRLTVNGTVHSTQVVVDFTVPGPDYVFDKGYALPTLTAIKAYVEKNHHLPEVPSAAEVKKNGINVGEINMLLLKKVEELTLYLIEKDNQLREQQTNSQRVRQQLDTLSEQLKELKSAISAKK